MTEEAVLREGHGAPGLVSLVHDAVPGRLRVRVAGLRGAVRLKHALEGALRGMRSITQANASVATGTLLVLFDPEIAAGMILPTIQNILLRYFSGQMESGPQPHAAWHALDVDETLKRLRSSMHGLSDRASETRLRRFGENALPNIPGRDKWEMLLEQFQSLPVALLIGAAALSIFTGGAADALVVLSVVGLNAGIGYVTEAQTERAVRALSQQSNGDVPVIRDGKRELVPIERAVPGDVLDLRPGVVVAADARIVAAEGLTINEATLTGESAPAAKSPAPLRHRNVPLADRANIAYRGTIVTGGSGRAVVIATGAATEIGQLQSFLSGASAPDTPLQKQLAKLGRNLSLLAGAACGAVFLVGLLRGFGLFPTLKNAVALAVAAIPEGLPTLATTTLALGVREMRSRHVLIRRLDAVETLASVRVVCLDKTGTLTFNRMTAAEAACDGEAYRCAALPATPPPTLRKLAEIVALCNEAPVDESEAASPAAPSATETALLQFAQDAGVDVRGLRRRYPLKRVSYRSERQLFMTTLHDAGRGKTLAAVKGSPEEVLGLCSHILIRNETLPLTDDMRRKAEADNARLAGDGQRVLGVAFREFSGDDAPANGLVFIGLIGLADPLRPGARDLIAALRRAGIFPVMITGDQRRTAEAIARSLDLGNGDLRIFDGESIPSLGDMSDAARIPHVFARVTPGQKLEIVEALQRAGHVVAMTGDGVNDSPALKAADIGIAMGYSGSEAARDAADIVLQDDRLESLAPALRQGRATHANIRRAIHYLLATNVSEILLMLLAPAAGLGQPLTPAQLLWINLVTDVGPALALGVEPPHSDALDAPPASAHEEILDRRSAPALGAEAGLITAGSFGAYLYGVSRYGASPRAGTICFTSIVAAQVLHALSARSEKWPFLSGALPPNPVLSRVVFGSFALQAAAMAFTPVRRLLGIAPIGPFDLAVAMTGAVAPFVANELRKGLPSGATVGETVKKLSHAS